MDITNTNVKMARRNTATPEQREHKKNRDHKRESLTRKVIRYPFRMTD